MMNRILSLLGLCMKAGFLSSGEVGVESAIKSGKAKILIISEDASNNTKKKFSNSSNYYGIKLITFSTKQELGRTIGKVERSILAVCNDGFAKKILEILENSDME